MRTTVTLDPDVLAMLRNTMREQGLSFKEVLNQAIRAGLQRSGPSRRAARYKLKSYRMGWNPNFRWDKALAVASEIEDEEITHKLQLRK